MMYYNNAVVSGWIRQGFTGWSDLFIITDEDRVRTITDIHHKMHKGDNLSHIQVSLSTYHRDVQ